MARQRKKSVRGGGSVFQRKDGRWEAKFKVEETGKYKSLYASSEKDAHKMLEVAKAQQRQGTLATGPQQTIKDFLEYWIEDVEKPSVGVSAYIGNRLVIRKYLIPGLGHIKIQKLTAHQLQMFYAKHLREGMSASRIRRLNIVLHKSFSHAKRLKLIVANVAEDIELPRVVKHKRQILDAKQAKRLLQVAKEQNLDTLLALAVVTAMRKGEILGLRWSDINMDTQELLVSRTVNYYTGYGDVETGGKTEHSVRIIKLPSFIVTMLNNHRALQLEAKADHDPSWVDHGLVFCRKNGGFIRRPTLDRQVHNLIEEANLPYMRFHDLRHSAATILLAMGIPANVIQELLGHADISTTLGIYGHVLPSMQQDAVDRMEDLYGE